MPIEPVSVDTRAAARTGEWNLKQLVLEGTKQERERSSLHHLKWSSPAVVGLFATALGLFGNLVVSWYNNESSRQLNMAKMQSELVLQAINSHSLQQSCQNLLFFIDTDLLKDPTNKITQECTHPLDQTYVPAFAAVEPDRSYVQEMAIEVHKSDVGSQELIKVAFTVPNSQNVTFNTVKIYCIQLSGTNRAGQKIYPSLQGSWKPGDRITFQVQVPRDWADPQKGWHLTFCVGSEASCLPSPNLLRLSS